MKYIRSRTALFLAFFVLQTSFSPVLSARSEVSEVKINRQVDSVFAKLTLREKVAQLFVIDFVSNNGTKLKAEQERLVKEEKIGGLITMGDKMIPALQRLNYLNRLASIPLLVSIDGEWGASMRYKELPPFPRQMQLGALSHDSLVYRMGYAIGKECRALNIHVNYAPDVDINNNPNNPVINTRSFGEDKEKVARFGVAYMRGMRDAKVAGSAKHFPGHGDTDVDSHKALPNLPFPLARLDSLEFYPFRHLIEQEVDMVMVGHLQVPALDSSGRPASISKPVITDFLRGRLGYNGIVCTDALNMDAVAKCSGFEKKQIPLEAYKAGADMLLMAEDVNNAITEIENSIKKGELSEAELDVKVKKMLALKARLGLFEKNYTSSVNLYNLEKRMVTDENLSLINRLSKNSITVVTNNGVLPLQDLGSQKIAYLGYEGDKNSKEFAQTLLRYAKVDTLILRAPVTLKQLEAAKSKLSGYDLIITGFNNTDFRPQRNFGIDTVQMQFLTNWAAGQPMVAVYFGSPYALNKIAGYEHFKAFVLGYTNTLENNFAAAQLLFGGIPAVGVLPVRTARFKAGEGMLLPEQARLGYDRFEPESKNSVAPKALGEFQMCEGMISGDLTKGDVPVTVKESAMLLTLLPVIAEWVEAGKIKPSDFLGNLLHLPLKKHDQILIFDLLNHRSGLPKVSNDFVFTPESVLNLPRSQKVLPEYSRANIYYLYKILESFDKDAKNSVLRKGDALIKLLEMNQTKLSGSGNIRMETTKGDLAKFFFMIFNNGRYAGKQVLSPFTANFIETLLPYYTTNSTGLNISQDKTTKSVRFVEK